MIYRDFCAVQPVLDRGPISWKYAASNPRRLRSGNLFICFWRSVTAVLVPTLMAAGLKPSTTRDLAVKRHQ